MKNITIIAVALVAAVWGSLAAEHAVKESKPAGKELYTAKCTKCHKSYDINKYKDADWQSWMQKMAAKAKLEKKDLDAINTYLATLKKK